MAVGRFLNNVSDHLSRNKNKYLFLLCMAALVTNTEAADEINSDCLNFRLYEDLCALAEGFRYTFSFDGHSVTQEDNRLERVATGTHFYCETARFFFHKLGETAATICSENPDIGIRLG
jgi:hypothetical protein